MKKKRSKAGAKPGKTRAAKALKPKGRRARKTPLHRGTAPARETEVTRLTRALSEAAEWQAATADLLKAMSRSAFDLQNVLDTLVRSAARLTQAEMGSVVQPEGTVFRQLASHGYPRELDKFMQTHPVHRGRGTITGRTLIEGKPIQVADVFADPEFTFIESAKIGGMRTMLGVPLLRDGEPIGVMVLSRRMVRPFSNAQIELVQNFAAQAVIAIENARLLTKLRQRTTDLSESLEQQTATSEVLQVISSSLGDLQPVFDAMLAKATKICAAKFGVLWLSAGEQFRCVALHNAPSAFADQYKGEPVVRPAPGTGLRQLLDTRKVTHVADMTTILPYIERDPFVVKSVELGGYRSVVNVPMLKENELIGAISIYHREVRPFTERQIELVSNFAAQAVIAIENARLLNELHQRTTDLTESLEQQTATSEVLQVISSSAGDLEPVFATVLEKAVRICDAKFGTLYLREGEKLRLVAARDVPPAFAAAQGAAPFDPAPGGMLESVIKTGRTVHLSDLAATRAYLERHPVMVQAIELGGIRTVVGVPMLKDAELIGLIGIFRQEVRPFTDKQVTLLTNFAAQAVIAIENARLLNELRQRTSDLTESLEQQTAASEVLQTISSSPGDLEPVFAAMLERAVRLGQAAFGTIYRWSGETARFAATYNTPAAFANERRESADWRPGPGSPVARMLTTKEVVHVPDLAMEDAYIKKLDQVIIAGVELGGVRTALFVPMLKDGELIGFFGIARQEIRPFTDKQIELVNSFAAQAVIAIENARLLNELRESLEQQTATAQILGVISRSTGDLAHVFVSILENATRICEAKFGTLYIKEGDGFRASAMHNAPAAYEEARTQLVRPSQHTTLWRAANSKRPVQITDVTLERGYLEGEPFVVSAVNMGGYRSVLSVPMIKEDEVVGVITIFRQEVSAFGGKHVSLLQNFAAQAVIAIENARLLNDLRDSTKQLRAQSEELADLNEQLEHRVADQVGEIERMGRLRRFLPPQVADLIVASGTEKQLESHRREITALFCDLRGFTGFTEIADAEDVMSLLRDYHAATGEIVIKYSGTLERYAGDGVMVIFNDPVPIENPPLQAVLMALEMREAIGALTDKWRLLGHDIGFGIGIAHGYATLGTIGFEGRFDYAAIGTVSNVASRLCDEAKPGQILISPRVLVAVNDAVTVEAVGEFELKGIRRPVAAYNVVAASPQSA
jgi:GAF domain-containing protein